jgi:hypothetical protein
MNVALNPRISQMSDLCAVVPGEVRDGSATGGSGSGGSQAGGSLVSATLQRLGKRVGDLIRR